MAPHSRSPPPRQVDSYRPNEQRQYSHSRRPRSRSPPRRDARDYYDRRRSRSPRNHPHASHQPPLPEEAVPPLPKEPLPYDDIAAPNSMEGPPGTSSAPSQALEQPPDDGWEPMWEPTSQAYYFYNRFTGTTQWENPRVPEATNQSEEDDTKLSIKPAAAGGYNPAIHGSYDPNADYAKDEQGEPEEAAHDRENTQDDDYATTAHFNRFSGKFQNTQVHPTHTPDAHDDEAKARRQMNAYFDVDAAANAHGGRSLRAERQSRRLTKDELQAFKEKKKSRKEEKRRAWLKD